MGEKIKVEELGCFVQVAKVIGVERAKVELFKAINGVRAINGRGGNLWSVSIPWVSEAFAWAHTPQGYAFWQDITAGINPYK